jgi:hypothetical protein
VRSLSVETRGVRAATSWHANPSKMNPNGKILRTSDPLWHCTSLFEVEAPVKTGFPVTSPALTIGAQTYRKCEFTRGCSGRPDGLWEFTFEGYGLQRLRKMDDSYRWERKNVPQGLKAE